MKSQEIQKHIDRAVGTEGILRIQSWWMHKILSDLVKYCEENGDASSIKNYIESQLNLIGEEIDGLDERLKNVENHELFEIVEELPTEPKDNTIYLVPSPNGEDHNVLTEWVHINGSWEQFGEFKVDIDLSEYAKKEDIHTPDWDAGEGEEGHIKNRTHYADFVEVDIPEDIASSEVEVTIPHIAGVPILVHYRGYVTSKYLKISPDDHELHVFSYGPAFKIRRGSGNNIFISGHNDENHRLYIATHFVELNEIFLPETIARKSEIATINGQPLTEGGDIVIEGGEGSYDDTEIQNKLTELSAETSHKVFSNGAIFNSIFSEVYFIGFSKDEIASITRVAYGVISPNDNHPMLSMRINGVIERFSILKSLSYSSGINYFGLVNGDEREGKRGVFVVSNGKWVDAAEDIQIYSSVLDIAQSPSIAEHILDLTPQNSIFVNLEFAATSKAIHKDGYVVDASASWAYTKPIAVQKGDLLKIHTDGNAARAVLAKTDENGSYYEALLTYDSTSLDYTYLADFNGYVAFSIYTAIAYHVYKISSPIVNMLASITSVATTEAVGVQSIEQITTSTESGGVNVIECTLSDGTKTQFYIRNGSGGSGGNVSVPNFNNVQLLPQPKFKKPLLSILAEDLKWFPTIANEANVGNTPKIIYDEVYHKMSKVEWVESTARAVMAYDLPSRMNLSKKVICGSIYIDEDIVDTSTMGITNLRLYSGGVNDAAHNMVVQIQWAGNNNEQYQRTGWFHFCVCPEANANSKGASFDISDVHRIAVHQVHTSASVKFGIGDFHIVDGLKKGGVVMLIDNFNPDVPEMADYIASKGLKATLSIVPSWIGNDSLHGTLEQIYKCAADGHLIINHTWTHNISNDQTAEDIFEEISKADKWMVRNGFARGSKIVSNPSAAHDLNKYRAYMDSEALMIYHHWTTMGSGDNFTLYYPYYPMSRLLTITSLESNGADYMINAVDKAVEVGGIAVLGWHGTWFDKENGRADFQRLIDHIASLGSDCTCYLVDDLIEGAYL